MLKNTKSGYGLVSIVLHWVIALSVFSLFALGLWMVGFDYYDPLYKTVPHIHKSVGVIVITLLVVRILWRVFNEHPAHLKHHKKWETLAASSVHYILYGMLLLMLPTGYLITTAKGQSLDVFNWFSIPALITGVENLENIAAEVHEWLAYGIIAVVSLHALGAIKHHVIDRDETLKRMIKPVKE